AVVVLHYSEGHDETGRPVLRHQAELAFHTDSKAAALITKVLGPAAPHLAEQCVGQIELFFSALVWYLDRHPEKAWTLLWGGLRGGRRGRAGPARRGGAGGAPDWGGQSRGCVRGAMPPPAVRASGMFS